MIQQQFKMLLSAIQSLLKASCGDAMRIQYDNLLFDHGTLHLLDDRLIQSPTALTHAPSSSRSSVKSFLVDFVVSHQSFEAFFSAHSQIDSVCAEIQPFRISFNLIVGNRKYSFLFNFRSFVGKTSFRRGMIKQSKVILKAESEDELALRVLEFGNRYFNGRPNCANDRTWLSLAHDHIYMNYLFQLHGRHKIQHGTGLQFANKNVINLVDYATKLPAGMMDIESRFCE